MIEIVRYSPQYAGQLYTIECASFNDPWPRSAFDNLDGFVVYVALSPHRLRAVPLPLKREVRERKRIQTPTSLLYANEVGDGERGPPQRWGDLAAYIILTHILDEGQIINIAVHPDYRRMGIANALIEKILEYSRGNGIKLLMLEVRESNAAAIKLYEKFEFREVGRRKRYYKNPIEDAILMDMEVKC